MSDTEQTPPSSRSGPIVLQVGEQRFLTSRDSLSRSDYLNAIASGRWDSNTQADGSFFIDADPEIFKHILRFLRHGVYPLCYDKTKGHDYATYAAIQKQADYLGVEKLISWLRKERYLQAITIDTKVQIVDDEDELVKTDHSDTAVYYHPTWKIVKKYVCPRGLSKHYDNPSACGKDCRKARGDAEDQYEDCPSLTTLTVAKVTVFNQHVCMED